MSGSIHISIISVTPHIHISIKAPFAQRYLKQYSIFLTGQTSFAQTLASVESPHHWYKLSIAVSRCSCGHPMGSYKNSTYSGAFRILLEISMRTIVCLAAGYLAPFLGNSRKRTRDSGHLFGAT